MWRNSACCFQTRRKYRSWMVGGWDCSRLTVCCEKQWEVTYCSCARGNMVSPDRIYIPFNGKKKIQECDQTCLSCLNYNNPLSTCNPLGNSSHTPQLWTISQSCWFGWCIFCIWEPTWKTSVHKTFIKGSRWVHLIWFLFCFSRFFHVKSCQTWNPVQIVTGRLIETHTIEENSNTNYENNSVHDIVFNASHCFSVSLSIKWMNNEQWLLLKWYCKAAIQLHQTLPA